jgi:hypothetical protein
MKDRQIDATQEIPAQAWGAYIQYKGSRFSALFAKDYFAYHLLVRFDRQIEAELLAA